MYTDITMMYIFYVVEPSFAPTLYIFNDDFSTNGILHVKLKLMYNYLHEYSNQTSACSAQMLFAILADRTLFFWKLKMLIYSVYILPHH